MPEIIQAVHAALSNAGLTKIGDIPLEPALPIKRSVLPGYICLQDGKEQKLKGSAMSKWRASWTTTSRAWARQ